MGVEPRASPRRGKLSTTQPYLPVTLLFTPQHHTLSAAYKPRTVLHRGPRRNRTPACRGSVAESRVLDLEFTGGLRGAISCVKPKRGACRLVCTCEHTWAKRQSGERACGFYRISPGLCDPRQRGDAHKSSTGDSCVLSQRPLCRGGGRGGSPWRPCLGWAWTNAKGFGFTCWMPQKKATSSRRWPLPPDALRPAVPTHSPLHHPSKG